MQTTATTGISSLLITMNERAADSSKRELIAAMMRKARKTDWDLVIARADRVISVAGAGVVILSLLYFSPILVSILVR